MLWAAKNCVNLVGASKNTYNHTCTYTYIALGSGWCIIGAALLLRKKETNFCSRWSFVHERKKGERRRRKKSTAVTDQTVLIVEDRTCVYLSFFSLTQKNRPFSIGSALVGAGFGSCAETEPDLNFRDFLPKYSHVSRDICTVSQLIDPYLRVCFNKDVVQYVPLVPSTCIDFLSRKAVTARRGSRKQTWSGVPAPKKNENWRHYDVYVQEEKKKHEIIIYNLEGWHWWWLSVRSRLPPSFRLPDFSYLCCGWWQDTSWVSTDSESRPLGQHNCKILSPNVPVQQSYGHLKKLTEIYRMKVQY